MKECPDCKEELEDGARKCKVCGSYAVWWLRLWVGIKDVVQFATFIAAIVVLFLMWRSNVIMQAQVKLSTEAIELTKKSITKEFVEFVEEKRPRIEIITTRIDISDTATIIHTDLKNQGFADAEDVFVYFVLKYEDIPEDTLNLEVFRFSKISKATDKVLSRHLSPLNRVSLTAAFDVRYTWVIEDLNYKEKKFFIYDYDEELEKYRIRVLTEEQIEQLWK